MKALVAVSIITLCLCAALATGVPYFVNISGAIGFCIACGVIGTVLASKNIKNGYYDDER